MMIVMAITRILEDLVQEAIQDVKHKSMELALGRLEGSPFSEEQLWRARERICDLLPAPETAKEMPERQPFMLRMLGQSMKLLNDPDWEILCQGPESFAEGVPLGCNGELKTKRTPQVFRARVKSRILDETDFQPIMHNYSSAELTQTQLEEKFKQDEALGRMIATTEAAVREEECPEVLVAALGAICKPNGDVRPLHDATHGVRINNRIAVPDRLETPGPGEIVELVTRARLRLRLPSRLRFASQPTFRLLIAACKSRNLTGAGWVAKPAPHRRRYGSTLWEPSAYQAHHIIGRGCSVPWAAGHFV